MNYKEYIMWKLFSKKLKVTPKIELPQIGDVYFHNIENPFECNAVEVLDIMDGYIQYRFCFFGSVNGVVRDSGKLSCEVKTFIALFNKSPKLYEYIKRKGYVNKCCKF